jgi:uncharacterized DUF497 family protein
VRFTWDPEKARINKAKHGVSFAEAATTFADPLALLLEDQVYADRGILIGQSEAARLLFTVYVEIHEDSIRIISARRATSRERRRYEEGT